MYDRAALRPPHVVLHHRTALLDTGEFYFSGLPSIFLRTAGNQEQSGKTDYSTDDHTDPVIHHRILRSNHSSQATRQSGASIPPARMIAPLVSPARNASWV